MYKKIITLLTSILLFSTIGIGMVEESITEDESNINQNYAVMTDPIIVPALEFQDDATEIQVVDTPDEFNWKDYNGGDWTTPAKNQGNCGSCWDFAAMGALECMVNIQNENPNVDIDLSEQYVLSCLPAAANYYGEGCLGGNPFNAFYYLKDDGDEGNYQNGAITEECFSYFADHNIACEDKCDNWEEHLIPISDCGFSWPGFDSLEVRDIIKSKIFEHGPVAAGIDCTNDFINWGTTHHSSDDYYRYVEQPWNNILNHLIVIVGWKDDSSISNGGYWICKNSWGTDWGYDGFYNAEYGSMFTGAFISWVSIQTDTENNPPLKPNIPIGPTSGKTNQEYEFHATTTDPEGQKIQYLFDWGDGTNSEWSDLIESEEIFKTTHSWSQKGNYNVCVMAKDENGDLSEWSDPLILSLPKTRSTFYDEYGNYYATMDIPLNPETIENKHTLPISTTIDFPAAFNWKNHNGKDWTTPAKHQGDCGSCWDFAALGTLESIIKIRENNPYINPDLSEQYVLSCLPAAANNYGQGCLGGTPYQAFYYLMDDGEEGNYHNGAITEECFSYFADHTIACEDKCDNWADQLIPITDCGEQFLGFDSENNRELIKNLIYSQGPISSGINVDDDFINWGARHHSENIYYSDPQMPWENMLNHMIIIVGWKDDSSIPNGGYWICKNSWGTDWGYDGFFNIEYGALFTGFYIAWVEYTVDNLRPQKPQTPTGPTSGTVDETCTYITMTTDPEGEDMYYFFDWGDGTDSGWIGPIESGNNCEGTIQFTKKGTYSIMVKAKDIHEYESEWSDPITVSMPKNKRIEFSIFQLFFEKMIWRTLPWLKNIKM